GRLTLGGDQDASDADPAPGGPEKPAEHPNQGGFARSRRPDHPREGAGGDGQRKVRERLPFRGGPPLATNAQPLDNNLQISSTHLSGPSVSDSAHPRRRRRPVSSARTGTSRPRCRSSSSRRKTSSGGPSRTMRPRSSTATRPARAASSAEWVM